MIRYLYDGGRIIEERGANPETASPYPRTFSFASPLLPASTVARAVLHTYFPTPLRAPIFPSEFRVVFRIICRLAARSKQITAKNFENNSTPKIRQLPLW
jgi:hypothetical protein